MPNLIVKPLDLLLGFSSHCGSPKTYCLAAIVEIPTTLAYQPRLAQANKHNWYSLCLCLFLPFVAQQRRRSEMSYVEGSTLSQGQMMGSYMWGLRREKLVGGLFSLVQP